jgi:hypothetical protein
MEPVLQQGSVSVLSQNSQGDAPRVSSAGSIRRIVHQSEALFQPNEDQSLISQQIKSLKDRIRLTPELADLERTDMFFLRRFLRFSDYDIEKAFNRLMAYHGRQLNIE